jgi:hypothetical protein
VVVFYDPKSEFLPFMDELPRVDLIGGGPPRVTLGECQVYLVRYAGSFFGLRAAVEPLTCGDGPEPVILYLPGVAWDQKGSILMELELRGLFGGAKSDVLLARWLASDERDSAIVEKEATHELLRLVEARLGLVLPADTALAEVRDKTLRDVLVGEFRSDLACEPPSSVSMVPRAPAEKHVGPIRDLASRLRKDHGDEYAPMAERVEDDLGLSGAAIDARNLGSIDTFRFEERSLLAYACELIVEKRYAAALEIVTQRHRSFWVDRDVGRQRQWGACRLMAELGEAVERVRPALAKANKDPAKWVAAYTGVAAYTADGGWYEADRAQRALETWVATMDEEPENDRALGKVRRAYEDLSRRMGEGFAESLGAAHWSVAGTVHQTRIWPDWVERNGSVGTHVGNGRLAYFLVDSLRFEMGVELARKLQGAEDLEVRPAVAALPTITPAGMAALLPGAAAGFSVVRHGVGHEVDTSDFHVEVIDLLGNKVSAEVGVAFFVAAYSI